MPDGNALYRSTLGELEVHVPFDALEPGMLGALIPLLGVSYFAAGQPIVGPESGVVDRLWIVKKGTVRGGPGPESHPGDEVLGPGECFPVGALRGHRATAFAYRAEADTFCWELPAVAFHDLLGKSERFRSFCMDHLALLVEQSHLARRAEAVASLDDAAGMLAPLRRAMAREPVSCTVDTPVSQVVRTLREARVGSMVVVDASGVPVGIFTTPDVLERVTLAQAAMDTPIRQLMTPQPVSLEEEAPLIEAALLMARHRIRHIIVTRDGRLAGVISERDLFALQRTSLRRTTEDIHASTTVAALAEAAGETRQLARHLLAQGVDAEHVTQMTCALNDGLSQRLLDIIAPRHSVAKRVRWCWISLGSEGRLEQTLATDQDNALIFASDGDVEPSRRALLEFAGEVNVGLDACGFPLCRGEIMARNPRWCLTSAEWQALFGDWTRNPGAQALLNATIFFDFRPIAGDASLAGTLRSAVLALTRHNDAFARALAENALTSRPPLGLLEGFVANDSAQFPGTLDLKARGARLFVDAARVISLMHGLPATGTAARLRAAAAAGALREDETAASLDAFHFIQGLRMQRQYLVGDIPPGSENRIDPTSLNEVDRRILKAALRQAALLQDRLRLDCGL